MRFANTTHANSCKTARMRRPALVARSMFLLAGLVLMSDCTSSTPPTPAATTPADPLAAKIAQYAPVDIAVDVGALPANEQQALGAMIGAASR